MDTNLMTLTVHEPLNNEFLYYVLSYIGLWKVADTTSIPQINNKHINPLPVPIPSPREQRAIAAALSDVDALIATLDKLIAKKRAIKTATMQQLLTGKQRLPGFDGEWEGKKLGDLVEIVSSGIYGEGQQREGLHPFRVATTANIDENDAWNGKEMSVRYFSKEQFDKYSPRRGDLIVVKSSGSAEKIQSGKVGYVGEREAGEFIFSNFLMLLRPQFAKSRFLYYFLTSYNVKRLLPTLVEASTYPNIRIDEYLNLDIPVPSQKEQTAIIDVLSDMDAEIAALEARRDKIKAIKQGMMQELLTGKTRLIENGQVKMGN